MDQHLADEVDDRTQQEQIAGKKTPSEERKIARQGLREEEEAEAEEDDEEESNELMIVLPKKLTTRRPRTALRRSSGDDDGEYEEERVEIVEKGTVSNRERLVIMRSRI